MAARSPLLSLVLSASTEYVSHTPTLAAGVTQHLLTRDAAGLPPFLREPSISTPKTRATGRNSTAVNLSYLWSVGKAMHAYSGGAMVDGYYSALVRTILGTINSTAFEA
jgi:hypothetical protein